MKVFVKDARLRRHSVDVDDGASVAHLKLLLANMSLVPAGFVPNLVYQQRTLGDHERIGNIGYSLERSISLICVRAAVASTAAAHTLDLVSPPSNEPNPSAAAQAAPASCAAVAGSAVHDASAASARVAAPSPSRVSPIPPAALEAASNINSSTHPSSAAECVAHAAAPAARTVQHGARVRIEGLQAAPQMNGRSGTVCGAFNEESGRWLVELDADGARPACRGTFRGVNLCVIPPLNFATEWLDEDGRVCPKNVDYATQCPKGHALTPLDGGGAPQAQQASGADVMCRVCHASTPRQHACEWLVCGVVGCCGGYAVCAACVVSLRCSHKKSVAASADDFCMMVSSSSPPSPTPPPFFSSLFECVCSALTKRVRGFRWSTCGG
jgi:hypothetical protein